MPPLPTWIDDRIDPALDKKLTQQHVVEVMLESERPFFSIQQLRARVKPTVSTETVRNRLDELREIDVVAAETYPDTITLYYVNHPESQWPLSPDGKRALAHDSPLETLSARDFLRLRNPAGIRTLVLAGFQLSLVLFCVGVGMIVLSIEAPSTRVTGCGRPPAISSSSVWSSSSLNAPFATVATTAPTDRFRRLNGPVRSNATQLTVTHD